MKTISDPYARHMVFLCSSYEFIWPAYRVSQTIPRKSLKMNGKHEKSGDRMYASCMVHVWFMYELCMPTVRQQYTSGIPQVWLRYANSIKTVSGEYQTHMPFVWKSYPGRKSRPGKGVKK